MAAIIAQNLGPANAVDPVVPEQANDTTQKVGKIANLKGHFIGACLVSGVSTLGVIGCVTALILSNIGGTIVPVVGIFVVSLLIVFLAIAVYEAYKARVYYANL